MQTSHTLASIRRYPNHELYKLKLVHCNPTLVVAVLTQKAVNLGVQFDNNTHDYLFNVSKNVGYNKKQMNLVRGAGLDAKVENISLDLADRDNRTLRADLRSGNGPVWFNLDEHLGLVEYYHQTREETFFRLGFKPPRAPGKSLVLCFDGTSNHFSNKNTNVVKFVELLKKDHTNEQMVYYQTGVGTYTTPAWMSSVTQYVAKTADKGIAWYLYQHVIDGYKFLMESYQAGDHIYIFGFSRGAFTARALAGMLHCVGLLPKHNMEHIAFAYEIYSKTSSDPPKSGPTSNSKDTTEVDFDEDRRAAPNPEQAIPDDEVPDSVIGSSVELDDSRLDVTVIKTPPNNPLKRADRVKGLGALGVQGNSAAAKADPEAYKQTFCSPIQIDFVGVWDTVASVGAITTTVLPFIDHNPSIRVFRQALALDEWRAKFVPSLWDHSRTTKYQDVREVWFRGNHSDIGGGSVLPDDPPKELDYKFTTLSNIALRWMVQQCFENKTHIKFDPESTRFYREENVLERRLVSEGRPMAFTYDGPPVESIHPSQSDSGDVDPGSGNDGSGAEPDAPETKASEPGAEADAPEPDAAGAGPEAGEQQQEVDSTTEQTQEENLLDLPKGVYKSYCQLDEKDINHDPSEPTGLEMRLLWWFLEILPSNRLVRSEDDVYSTSRMPNFARGRDIYRRRPTDPIYIHDSVVKYILSEAGKEYEPRATWHGYEDPGEFPSIDSYVHRLHSDGNTRFVIDKKLSVALKLKPKPEPETERGAEEQVKSTTTSFMGKVGSFLGWR